MLLGISEIEEVVFEVFQEVFLQGTFNRSLRVVPIPANDFNHMLALCHSHVVLVLTGPKLPYNLKVRFVELLFRVCLSHAMQVNLIYSLLLIKVYEFKGRASLGQEPSHLDVQLFNFV